MKSVRERGNSNSVLIWLLICSAIILLTAIVLTPETDQPVRAAHQVESINKQTHAVLPATRVGDEFNESNSSVWLSGLVS